MKTFAAFLSIALTAVVTAAFAGNVIVCPPDAPANVKLAAKEIRRYAWLRTGELLPIAATGSGIALKVDPALSAQQHRLKSDGTLLTISGGSDVAVLYGAYAFAEKLGVRFEINRAIDAVEAGIDVVEAEIDKGLDILGTLADASGNWLVRWSRIGGPWNVVRVQQIPDKHYLTGVGSSGRLALMHCAATKYAFGSPIGCDWRAAVWDPPYAGDPVYLPNIAGSYSWTGGVTDDGAVVGVTVASNDVDMLPVLWPTPTTLVSLPLLSGGKSGGGGCCFNSYGQLAGYVDVPVKGRSRPHAVVWSLH